MLESLAETRAILSAGWEQELESHWAAATHKAAAELGAVDHAHDGPPEEWDGYEIKLARLRKAARRLHELLFPLGASAQLLTEQSLSAAEGRLHGRPDLIVRTDEVHWLLDYKTGPVISRESREPRDSYVRQLRLYAYLQAETSGDWPERALLVPLQGPVVEVDIDRAACTRLAHEALELLAEFNARAPEPQTATPAPDTCRWCPYATICPAFWESCDEQWASTVLATAGSTLVVTHPYLGGISLTVDADVGSLGHKPINVRAISAEDHPAVAFLREGMEVALVGLRRDREGESLTLPEHGRVWVRST